MVYVVITGRLGNILFQVAAARTLSKEVTAIALNEITKDVFIKYQKTLFKEIGIMDFIPEKVPEYNEKRFQYDRIQFNSDSVILKGFFQSYKYLNRSICQKLFSCPIDVQKDIDSKYGSLEKDKMVSVNVRRGDYLRLPHRHPFCGLKYYKNAINYFGNCYLFLICSDDIKWCKSHFRGDNFIFVENSYPLMDLYVQTICHHNIISNSSFSWWGAFLNPTKDQIVIAPKRWFGHDLKEKDSIDLLPDNYILMDCSTTVPQWILTQVMIVKDWIKSII